MIEHAEFVPLALTPAEQLANSLKVKDIQEKFEQIIKSLGNLTK